jgi:hypothetical protein
MNAVPPSGNPSAKKAKWEGCAGVTFQLLRMFW